ERCEWVVGCEGCARVADCSYVARRARDGFRPTGDNRQYDREAGGDAHALLHDCWSQYPGLEKALHSAGDLDPVRYRSALSGHLDQPCAWRQSLRDEAAHLIGKN